MQRKSNAYIQPEELLRQQAFLDALRDTHARDFLQTHHRVPRYAIVTYGCQMNERDSEHLRGMLERAGWVSGDASNADLLLFNTCCVREHAEQRVFGNVGALRKRKQLNPDLMIGVCGCMMQQEETAKELMRKFPFVDIVFGTHALHAFPELFYRAVVSRERVFDVRNSDGQIAENMPTQREMSPSAYVTIMYGCNNFCTYCIVPYVRGRERSRFVSDIEAEIRGLIAQGVREVTLLGQNVNSYGLDLQDGLTFPALLRSVDKISGLERIRFMSSHPKDFSKELIAAMAQCDKVCNHLHLPIQSGSDGILRRMNRGYTREGYLRRVDELRAAIPGVTLTTDVIVGFPGETDEDFRQTLRVMEEVDYASSFTFMYSPRKGTPAAAMEGQIDEKIKKERLYELNALQERLTEKDNQKYLGKSFDVLVEGHAVWEKPMATGKTDTFKTVYFPGDAALIGQKVHVKMEQAKKTCLLGSIVLDQERSDLSNFQMIK